MIAVDDSPCPVIASTSPLLAPENDRICAKVVAPRMMNRIIAEIDAVPRNASTIAFQLRARYSSANTSVANAPTAAHSVGVAQPATSAPTTTPKIDRHG